MIAVSVLSPRLIFDAIKKTIGVDRFIKHGKLYDNWFFGDDNRGDLLYVEFSQSIVDNLGINLDFKKDLNELSFLVILHQFLATINFLEAGGSLVVSFFKSVTKKSRISVLYIVC
uniref:Uncharacterized protein n=1 Tax=Tetranychus urticae TaxID=32264 RepID=T1KPV5_TETUR